MHYIEQFAYANKLRQHHPLERFVFGCLSMLICLACNNSLVHILTLVIMLLLLIKTAEIPLKIILKLFAVPLGFLFIGVLAIVISMGFTDTNMMLSIRLANIVIGITQNNLFLGLITLTKSLSCVACLYFIALTIPLMELLYVLKMFKVPTLILELMMLIYRFIFVFIEIAINIYTAQSSRLGHGSIKQSINSFGLLFANLWAKGYIKSQALFTSLLSRGYKDELKVLYSTYQFSMGNIASYSLFILLLLAVEATL